MHNDKEGAKGNGFRKNYFLLYRLLIIGLFVVLVIEIFTRDDQPAILINNCTGLYKKNCWKIQLIFIWSTGQFTWWQKFSLSWKDSETGGILEGVRRLSCKGNI